MNAMMKQKRKKENFEKRNPLEEHVLKWPICGNEYIIYCYVGEYANNVLYCGSVHFKDNSLVVFSIKKENEKIVLDFINRLLSNSYSSMYQILDIRNMLKLEIVSSNSLEMDHTVIEKLDVLSIPNKKEEELVKEREKKPIFLYVLLVLLIILFLGALYFYFNMPICLSTSVKSQCLSVLDGCFWEIKFHFSV